eukprot:TRINITY_DN660_c0_g1_i1.p1 TRINITY_DN660_c0_g1~~TRINITY_DN660_c0_g1_i1.p1  ORF type:complete len:160 (-),score=48.98 TRINITY_DN660_c0_g1_i1:86-565(-)
MGNTQAAAGEQLTPEEATQRRLARKPTMQECLSYRLSLDYVVSNLKYSTIHHDAVADGTMLKAWEQESDMLREQLSILSKFYQHNNQAKERMIQQLTANLEEAESQIERQKNPDELKRCRGMQTMHHQFVRTLESMIPLLKEECPDGIELHRKEPSETK